MKIKYLKQAPQGMPGDVAEVPDLQASILIKLKFAEAVDDGSIIQFLKNLNGTSVVDDFGSFVELQKTEINPEMIEQKPIQKPKPVKPKQIRASKAK
ncbi:hypothetical protein [Acinetobacter bohemicus]|uniref:hypothetical protein n=1 Tax=Acinetobacter bohemicus TaxID=1435036 RepID=UPI00192CE3F0|nr:hypothetical protein [Acinetobacter bohemicus]CAD9197486.1 hypothetical protein QAC21B_03660 [Acinetobacter bohemicus]